jgi:hypothetical protein
MSTGLLDFTYDSQLVDQHDHCIFVVVEDIGAEFDVCVNVPLNDIFHLRAPSLGSE